MNYTPLSIEMRLAYFQAYVYKQLVRASSVTSITELDKLETENKKKLKWFSRFLELDK